MEMLKLNKVNAQLNYEIFADMTLEELLELYKKIFE